MSKLWAVIPAAGKSQRFVDAGYSIPKPLLKLKSPDGKVATMIEFVKDTVPPGVGIIEVLHLEKTLGQADSIYQTVKNLPINDRVLILDCDTILPYKDIHKLIQMLESFNATVAVAETFDPNCSRVNQIPFPTRFVEKKSISQYGIIGARAFDNCGILIAALARSLIDFDSGRRPGETEPYLSTAMNYYLGTKYAHLITEYVDLGTPQRIKEAGWEIV